MLQALLIPDFSIATQMPASNLQLNHKHLQYLQKDGLMNLQPQSFLVPLLEY